MSILVTEDDIAQIVALGTQKHPHEACGILITGLDSGRVKEVPNRAENPAKDTVLTSADVRQALEEMLGDYARYPGNLNRELVVWHTHPGGLVGPSREDMQFRKTLGDTRCLVVTIPTGEAVQF